MSALKNCSQDLRIYLLKHHLPDVFESLLTALAINQPTDGKAYIVEKIQQLQNDQALFNRLQWDTFIDDDKKPTNRMVNVDFLWSSQDVNTQPTVEMLEKAYSHYNKKLLSVYYGALRVYWLHKVEKKQKLELRLNKARKYYSLKICRKYYDQWLTWLRGEKLKQNNFVDSLSKIYNVSLMRIMFGAWHSVAVDNRKTREYFERIERGEIVDPTFIDGDKKDHISLMSKQTAVNIFRFIDLPDLVNCSKVCRSWKEITQMSILWSRINLANAEKGIISSKAITSLIQKCRPFLCHINVRACDFLVTRTLKSIGDCRNLQDLNISSCKGVNDDVTRDITVGCPSLLYVNLSRTEISDASLRYLSRNCNSLQYLNISHCLNITNRGLQYLSSGKGSQKLIYLDMSGCDQITSDGYKVLSKGCTRLNSILLNEMPSLSDECVEALMTDCRNLRMLSIMHSPLLTDAAMKSLSSSKKLQIFKLEGNNRLTDATVKTLIRNSPELRHFYFVDVQRVTDMSLKALGQAKHLQVLNLADCVRLSDTGIRYLVEGFSGSKIRELNLTNCIRVSDVSLLRISQKCASLAYANFSYCEHITDAGVELLASIGTLISIDLSGCNVSDPGIIALGHSSDFKDIVLSECCNITDTGIQKLVPRVKDLETLDLSHLNLITDQSIKSIAFCCRRLRVLNISGCNLLSDQGLQYLSGVCKFIEKLDISGCKLITDRALRYIRKGCHNMKTLTMLYCHGISKSGAAKMQNKMKGGKVLHSQEDTVVYLGNRVN